jgi:hypothetical protein
MLKVTLSPALGWIRRTLVLLAVFGGSAQAAVYTGVWDPPYGSPFTGLGWRGTADYFVPDSCIPTGTSDVSNSGACGNEAVVTSAQVELYNIASPSTTISTLIFNASTMIIGTLRYVAGELSQLTTANSNFLNPTEDLSAFGVGSNTEFSLFFTLTGPRLQWRDCGRITFAAAATTDCTGGLNDDVNFRPEFTITRVPEPGTLALAVLAMLALVPVMRRRMRLAPLPAASA